MTFITQRARHLEYIAANMPSVSPLSKEWPKSPQYMKAHITVLKRIFHKWRVGTYRVMLIAQDCILLPSI